MSGDKILLTGVCFVHRLLQLRYEESNQISRPNHIRLVHPDFKMEKVNFFRDDISKKFLFTDFHGKYSSIKTEANNLFQLLRLYQNECKLMYVVGGTGINSVDVAAVLTEADYRKFGDFWYFLFNEKWNPIRVKQWAEQRDMALKSLLFSFPNLKFIFYQPFCVKWWEDKGLPKNRMLFWNIDWGMTAEQFEEIRQNIIDKGLRGGHRFPTEESYNELCDMILHDYEHVNLKIDGKWC